MRKLLAFAILAASLTVAAVVTSAASASLLPAGRSSARGSSGTARYVHSFRPDPLTAGMFPSSPIGAVSGVVPHTSGWHCDLYACIDVLGTKLVVNGLDAEGVVFSQSGCAFPWWYDGDDRMSVTGPTICWDQGAGQVFGYRPVSRTLPDNDRVNLLWLGTDPPAGNPHIYIRS